MGSGADSNNTEFTSFDSTVQCCTALYQVPPYPAIMHSVMCLGRIVSLIHIQIKTSNRPITRYVVDRPLISVLRKTMSRGSRNKTKSRRGGGRRKTATIRASTRKKLVDASKTRADSRAKEEEDEEALARVSCVCPACACSEHVRGVWGGFCGSL